MSKKDRNPFIPSERVAEQDDKSVQEEEDSKKAFAEERAEQKRSAPELPEKTSKK